MLCTKFMTISHSLKKFDYFFVTLIFKLFNSEILIYKTIIEETKNHYLIISPEICTSFKLRYFLSRFQKLFFRPSMKKLKKQWPLKYDF